VLGGGRTTPALAVERSVTFTTDRLQDATAGPWELTQELQPARLKAHVVIAPATPDALGTWFEVTAPRVLPPGQDPAVHDRYDEQAEQRLAAERLRGVEVHGDEVRTPVGYPYELVLIASVAAPGTAAALRRPRANPDRARRSDSRTAAGRFA
jgi:hypothetical protein